MIAEPSARSGPRVAAVGARPVPILAVYAGSRAIVALAALVVGPLVPRNPALTSAAGGPLLAQLTSWDGWWYLGIARDGYHAAPLTGQYHDYAFFPLYPALVRALSLATPAFDGLIAVLLSNVLFLVALGLLYRLTAEVLDEERAAWSCVVLCLFPFSFVFSMAYAESLFLALSLGALLAAERGHAATASLLAGLAGLTRLPGVLLVVPLALILWKRLDDRRALAWLVLVPLGAVAFTAWVGTFAGAAGGFGGAQAAWGRNGIGAAAAIGGNLASQLDPLRLSFLVALLAYVFLLVYLRPDRIPLPYATIPILTLAAVLMSGDLESVGRYGMVAFPFVWVLAGRRRFRAPWTALSAVLLLAASVAAFSGRMTP